MEKTFLNDKRIIEIAKYYGEEAQINVVQEECSELIQAICKIRRYNNEETRHRMIEEMSDLYLVLGTLNYYLNDAERQYFIDNFNKKLDRQMERLKKDKEIKENEKKKIGIKYPCDSCPNWNGD